MYEVGKGTKTEEQPRKDGKFAPKDANLASIEEDVNEKTAKEVNESPRNIARFRAYAKLCEEQQITEYVIIDNLLRRHLPVEQRAFLEYELYKLRDKQTRVRG